MRVVLSTFGSMGDVQPMLALAAELRQTGHQPVLALSPNFAERAAEVEVDFAPTGPALPDAAVRGVIAAQMQDEKPADQVRHFLQAYLPCLPEVYRSLLSTCQNADLLVSSPYQLAGRMVHDSTQLPFVSLHLSHFSDLGGKETRAISESLINPYRIGEGLDPVMDPLGSGGQSPQLAIYAVSRHLLQKPPHWGDHCKVVGFFFLKNDYWKPEPELEAFCSGGEPLVVVGFGSVMHSDPDLMTRIVVEAVQDVGCRTVIQRGWSELTTRSPLPSNARAEGFLPHSWLFSRASVVVHHGGAGTTASAFRAGVPTVVVPHSLDQPIWAEFARAKGCARNVIPFKQLTARRLAAAIRGTLAASEVSEAAARFGAQIRLERGVEEARELVECFSALHTNPAHITNFEDRTNRT